MARRRVNWPAIGAVLVVLGFWIGGKFHPAGFVLAAIPIGIWAWLSLASWRRTRHAGGRGPTGAGRDDEPLG